MKRRFIFDLDGTLLISDFSKEKEYFKSILDEESANIFIPRIYELLLKYENIYKKYDVEELSCFLKKETNIEITPKMICEWIDINSESNDVVLDETIDMLEYLKKRRYSLVVLTNWFRKTQVLRLKNKNLLDYFDYIYAGDLCVKPNIQSYINAVGRFKVNECVMIGDNLKKDVLKPQSIGIDSIFYNPNNESYNKKLVKTIDSFERIKEIY